MRSVRLVCRLVALALVLQGCGAQKPRPKPVLAPTAGAAEPDDPALRTARGLFPDVFGLPAAKGALSGGIDNALYVPLTEYYPDVPAAECLNLLGQPARRGSFFGVSVTDLGSEGQNFMVMSPLVFRDRRAGYILGIPSGAQGSAQLVESPADVDPDAEAQPPRLDPEQGLWLDRLVIIEPNGNYSQGRAGIDFGPDGVVQVCPIDNKRRAPECQGESQPPAPALPDALPYRYDVTRCAPGCEALCPSGVTHLEDCSHPPLPVCEGKALRLFLPGNDIGERCQYETWSMSCASSCAEGRCDEPTPTLAFSVSAPEGRLVLLASGAPALVSEDAVVTFSTDGRELSRVKAAQGHELPPVATPDGGVVLFGRAGYVEKLGGARPWQTHLDAKPSSGAGSAVIGGTVYAALGKKLFLLDEATGKPKSSLELPDEVKGTPVPGPSGSVLLSFGKELFRIDGDRPPTRVPLPAAIVGEPLVDQHGEIIVATEDGNLSLVAGTTVKTIASVGKFIRRGPVLVSGGRVLVATSEKQYDGPATLSEVGLAAGRVLFSVKLDEAPRSVLVDPWRSLIRGSTTTRYGNVFVVSDGGISALTAHGARRWSLDLMGEGHFPQAALAGDGTLYFASFQRLSALAPGKSPEPAQARVVADVVAPTHPAPR